MLLLTSTLLYLCSHPGQVGFSPPVGSADAGRRGSSSEDGPVWRPHVNPPKARVGPGNFATPLFRQCPAMLKLGLSLLVTARCTQFPQVSTRVLRSVQAAVFNFHQVTKISDWLPPRIWWFVLFPARQKVSPGWDISLFFVFIVATWATHIQHNHLSLQSR